LGLSHQFTHYESNVKPLGNPNAPGQHVESNVSQVFANYLATDRLFLQINVPLIYRSFRRVSFGQVEEGTEKGLGDISGLVKWRFLESYRERTTNVFDFYLGAKLPTGSSDRLQDELPQTNSGLLRHGGPGGSLISGDLLALGTGSVDGILGSSWLYQLDRWLFLSNLQYQVRGTGSYDYRLGNDLQVTLSPGRYLILEDDRTLSTGLRLSGEWKESNTLDGILVPQSSEQQIFVGGFAQFTVGDATFFSGSLEFPVSNESPDEEVVPRYRVQATVSVRF
jgi:hypothetical protein